MKRVTAYTLVELLIVVAILSTLALVAVPRLQFGAIRQRKAEAATLDVVSALRRTRSLAILYAATNQTGFALHITSDSGSTGYEIEDLSNSHVVDSRTLDGEVACAGGTSFEFGPLGTLKQGSDSSLAISAGGRTCTVTIVSGTGLVKWDES
jgi:prepilin-type N-terminal cleavage/methylation domain-containing protein